MSLVASLSILTRQLGRLAIQESSLRHRLPAVLMTIQPIQHQPQLQVRSFGKSAKKYRITKKKKGKPKFHEPKVYEPALQHQAWVQFQQDIAVEGFETGQTTEIVELGKRRKQVKMDSRSARLAERRRLTDVKGGEYPPLVYSPEETERLLAEAYSLIPPKAGRRGTRNLKRQKRRWFLVRKLRKKYKYQLARHQERKMIKRSLQVKQVKEVIASAPETRQQEREYQARLLQKWMANMTQSKKEAEKEEEIVNKQSM